MNKQNVDKDKEKSYTQEKKSCVCTADFLKKEFHFYRKKYKIYQSFSKDKNKDYDLKMTSTITGLLEDVAATVTTSRKDMQEKTINGIFSAYCLYICASCSSNPQKAYDALFDITQNNQNPIETAERIKIEERESFDITQNNQNPIDVIIAWLKEQKKHGKNMNEIHFRDEIKKMIISRLRQTKEKDYSKKNFVDKDGTVKRKRYKKMTPIQLEIQNEDGSFSDNMELVKVLEDIAYEKARFDTIKIVTGQALKYCSTHKKITEEQCKILCWTYGLGSGFQKMTQKEIAEKLGTNVYNVRKNLAAALSVLKDYFNKNNLWHDFFNF